MIMNSLIIKTIVFINTINVYADGYVAQNFCQDISNTLKLASASLLIVRLCVPIFIIVMATMDLYKTVTTGKVDELTKGLKTLAKRFAIGLIVLFLPTIVNLVVNAIDKSSSDYKVCLSCLESPKNC